MRFNPDNKIRISFDAGVLIYVKMCAGCKITKNVSEINFRKDRHPDTANYCFECRSIYNKARYKNDPEKRRTYAREWASKNRVIDQEHANWLRERRDLGIYLKKLKSENPCADCNNFFPAVCMDFDHCRGSKFFSLSQYRSRSQSEVMDELLKCDLVCSNCHRIRTNSRPFVYRRANQLGA